LFFFETISDFFFWIYLPLNSIFLVHFITSIYLKFLFKSGLFLIAVLRFLTKINNGEVIFDLKQSQMTTSIIYQVKKDPLGAENEDFRYRTVGLTSPKNFHLSKPKTN